MAKTKQTQHDKLVRSNANKLKREGYDVVADISGYKKPKGIGKNNRVPDIVARKNGRTKIIEVETPKSLKKDKDQHTTFRKSAAQRKNTTFRIETTKKKKS